MRASAAIAVQAHEKAQFGIEATAALARVVVRATVGIHDLEGLTRPLLEALAEVSGLESTYLSVFDWAAGEERVRFVYAAALSEVREGMTMAIPAGVTCETAPGVTLSAHELTRTHSESLVAQRLGLGTFVGVPVIAADRRLFGMLCGAARTPGAVGDSTISIMELVAQIIADHVNRQAAAAAADRATHAKERARLRAQFLAEAEHQLKTPLTVLTGASNMLLEDWAALPEDRRQAITVMVARNSGTLTRLLDELLLEARSDVQVSELIPVQVDLHPFIRTIADAFGVVSAAHEIVAEVDTGAFVSVDPAPLYQVLGHLLDNAIKYSPGGGVIRIRVTRGAQDFQIDVVDDGTGVPEGIDIFEPFRRGDPGPDRRSGIGLGLHIVRNLVLAMGGTVAARRNTPGPGSTITVRLPAQPWAPG